MLEVERMADVLEAVADAIVRAPRVIGFTGAGISTESGIPDFRSPDGVWARRRPIVYREFMTDPNLRREAWQLRREFYPPMAAANPNAGHLAFSELERLGKLSGLVTQNIDGLHQKAGNSPERIIELHGTTHWAVCTSCACRFPMPEIMRRLEAGEVDPACTACGGILKAATVFFGQPVPADDINRAFRWARSSDLMLVAGSSLVVHPACDVPAEAKAAGAMLVIINRTATPLDSMADFVVDGQTGELLPAIVERVRRRLGDGRHTASWASDSSP